MKDTEDMLQEYMANNRMFHFDGERGVRNLKQVLTDVCGYKDDWGGVLANFFADNPGATEAVLEWISAQQVSEWTENLKELTASESANLTDEGSLTA